MGRACVVCGTGTDVGKSVVCAGLLKNLPTAQAVKIIQTGNGLIDQALYQEACPEGRSKTLRHFTMAASPHLAAQAEGQSIAVDSLVKDIQDVAQGAELTLLEASGGVMVPLSATETFLDVLERLEFPIILVVGNVLGAINHALLSLAALKAAGLTVAGLVFTHPDPACPETHPIAMDNMRCIAERGNAAILGIVPHIPHFAQAQAQIQGRDAAWQKVAASLEQAAARLATLGHGPGRLADTAENLTRFDRAHLWHPYAPAPESAAVDIAAPWLVTRTAGNYIHLQDGRRLLDGMASWWSAIHGYGRPELTGAVSRQAREMSHVMFGGLTHAPAVELARRLLPLLPEGLEAIFWADSGSVSVEVALKMAVQYWRGRGNPHKAKIISHSGAYHGDTLGAMSVCDPVNSMHAGFKGLLPQHIFAPRPAVPFHVPFDPACLDAVAKLVEQHHHECAAVIIEPVVQGAGGMWLYHPDYLKGLYALCRRFDLLLICDEIATGFGRTGKMFAAEWAGVTPDILCLGKALTGGMMTLAATVCTRQVAAGISRHGAPLMHGPTFMANPLACRAALASLDLLLSSDWEAKVHSIERALEAGLAPCRDYPDVRDVRVLGAIGVVEMEQPVNVPALCRCFVEQHQVWIRPFGRLIYIMPPYTTTEKECARLCAAIRAGGRKETF